MSHRRGRPLLRVLAVVAAVLAGPAAARAERPAGATPPAASTSGVRITLGSVSPAIARGDQDVVIDGTITNERTTSLRAPDVRLAGSFTPLLGRAAVGAWAGGEISLVPLTEIDHDTLTGTLTPGSSAPFRLTVPEPGRASDAAYGALPMLVSAGGATVSTFVAFHRRVEYEPVSLAVLAPITMASDAALIGPYGPQRLAAWRRQLSRQAASQRLLDATGDLPVTWAFDPTLLHPPAAIPGIRPEDPAAGVAWDRVTPEQRAETALRRSADAQLRDRLVDRRTLVLPRADADLGALLDLPGTDGQVAPALAAAARVAGTLPDAGADVLWPADGRLGTDRVAALVAAAAAPVRAVIGAASSLAGANTTSAPHPGPGGTAVLAYDDRLAGALLHLADDPTGARTTQQVLADSLALLAEFPGTIRTALIAVPRGLAAPAPALERTLTTLLDAPWITPVGLDDLVAQAAGGTAIPARAPEQLQEYAGIPRDPSVPRPGLSPARVGALRSALAALEPVAQVRADGADNWAFWSEVLQQCYSSRWRSDRVALRPVISVMRAAGNRARSAVAVVPGRINFFAESGQLQITIINDLEVAVERVRVELTSLVPSFRIGGSPDPVTIGAGSRATVRVPATALAAGSVPIRVALYSPSGQHIGVDNTVQVRAYPTGSWFYWVIGALAALLFLAGWWRSRGRRRAGAVAGSRSVDAAAGADRTSGSGRPGDVGADISIAPPGAGRP